MKAMLVDYVNTPFTNPKKIKELAYLVRAIDHELRLGIIKFLHEKSEATVTELWVKLRVEDQATISQHLSILRKANLVNSYRSGKFIYYSVNYKTVSLINKTTNEGLGKLQNNRRIQKQTDETKKMLD